MIGREDNKPPPAHKHWTPHGLWPSEISYISSVLLSKKDCRLCGKEREDSLCHCPMLSLVKKDMDSRTVSWNWGSSSKEGAAVF